MNYLIPSEFPTIHRILAFLHASSRRDAEFVELESKIPKSGIDHLTSPSMDFIKKSCKVLLRNIFCTTILMLLLVNMEIQQLTTIIICIGASVAFYFVEKHISITPENLQVGILCFNGIAYFMIHLTFQVEHKGLISIGFPCMYTYHFYLATLTPSKRHITCMIFGVTVFMQFFIGMYKLGEIDVEHFSSAVFSVGIFFLGLETNQTRLSQMYQMILENDKLAKEKQKVVQQFPHPVLILPQEISEDFKCYSNDQFEHKIKALNQVMKELDDVEVSFKKNDQIPDAQQEIQSLLQYLRDSEDFEQNGQDSVKRDLVIKCLQFLNNDSESSKDIFNNQHDKRKHVNRNFNIKSLKIEWKGVPSVMHVFIDTTDIINLEQAKNRIKMQKIMFASASHEFRTPLNAIINSFEIIKSSLQEFLRTVMEDTGQNVMEYSHPRENIDLISKFIRTGSTSSLLLMALVEDILNLSKIDNGTFTIKLEFFQVPELLQEVHSLFTIQCENKGVDLLIECDDTLHSCEIRTDCNRIRQVLLNLVSNSSKFTFNGFIKIKVCMVKSLDGSDYLEFRVQDTGTGIKEQDQECLFKLFGVLEDNEDLNPNGCGLGLTISKKYVELLGGEIHVESIYGEGTEMIFTILITEIKRLPSLPDLSSKNLSTFSLKSIKPYPESDLKVSEEHISSLNPINKLHISDFTIHKWS
ncbi:unnamed protein product [Moneuplotes crassus]|uniref:histidine kinase n=1 Tax=Euplotes crassus TaxID=5936 RepID=A0AAD1Y223_EUPCR|nr:unnamed protein product [Moneuplotes crassus]